MAKINGVDKTFFRETGILQTKCCKIHGQTIALKAEAIIPKSLLLNWSFVLAARFIPAFAVLFFCAMPFVVFSQEPPLKIEPLHYVCYKTSSNITMDGLLNEAAWQNAPFTEPFVDIEGSLKPAPTYKTQVKMLWDDKYLYIAARMGEPHVWGTLTQRESVIFYDNDFEVFIDPDGDTHHYVEYEMNALNTQWDLMLVKPYRDESGSNVAINNWNFNGIRSAVYVDGTLNNPTDTDKGWTVEIALPLASLAEVSATGKAPVAGEQYRVNFSRVEWDVDVKDGKYVKRTHLVNGVEKPLPEHNWVWSPQGVIAMHQPETWGTVQFSALPGGTQTETFRPDTDNDIKWALRMIYYREKEYFPKNKCYTADLTSLRLADYKVADKPFTPEIKTAFTTYVARLASHTSGFYWYINNEGRVWREAGN